MNKVINFINRISKEYGYKKLTPEKSKLAQEFYTKYLPELYDDEPLYTPKGELLATAYNRVVIGDYGAYLEISPEDLHLQLFVKPGQEFRLKDDFKGKYIWYTSKFNDCKIYFQLRGVSYADYKPGMFYISVYEVNQFIHTATGYERV